MIGQRILAATLKRFLGLRPATQVLTLTPPLATQMISDVANYAKERGRITAQRNLARCKVECIASQLNLAVEEAVMVPLVMHRHCWAAKGGGAISQRRGGLEEGRETEQLP